MLRNRISTSLAITKPSMMVTDTMRRWRRTRGCSSGGTASRDARGASSRRACWREVSRNTALDTVYTTRNQNTDAPSHMPTQTSSRFSGAESMLTFAVASNASKPLAMAILNMYGARIITAAISNSSSTASSCTA